MIGVFLQVRLTSGRLPRKALLPLGGKPLIQQVMFRLEDIQADAYAILTTENSADAIGPLAIGPFKVFVGPEEDVLQRYINAAKFYGVDTILRATGDNPLINPRLCSWLMGEHFDRGADLTYAAGAAVGAAGDVVETAALWKAASLVTQERDREHVTTHIKEHPLLYAIHHPLVPREWQSSARISVDTPEDYEAIKRFF